MELVCGNCLEKEKKVSLISVIINDSAYLLLSKFLNPSTTYGRGPAVLPDDACHLTL